MISACEATSKSESEMKNKVGNLANEPSISIHSISEPSSNYSESLIEDQEDESVADDIQKVVAENKEEVNKLSSDIDTDDSVVSLQYLDFKGHYAYYEGETHNSHISETLLLEEDYIQWAGMEANVQNYNIQDHTLELTAIQQVKDPSSDQVLNTNTYHLNYTLDYWNPYKVLISPNGKVYYEMPYEEKEPS